MSTRLPSASTRARRSLIRELGIGIAVTDHNSIHGAVEIDRFKEVFSIPGIELTSYEGTHLLVYFYDIRSLLKFYSRDVQPFMGAEIMSSLALEMEEIIRRARQFETLIIFPHPYCGTYTGVHNPYFAGERFERILGLADGVEVINSENLNKWNLKSALLGFNLNRSITGGSDGHRLVQMGRVVTAADCAWKRRSFLDAVRRRKVRVIGNEIDILRKMTSSGANKEVDIQASDPYLILHTAAVAGIPRGATLSHGNIIAGNLQHMATMGLREEDSYLHMLPLFHIADLALSFAVMHAGGKNVLMTKFDPELALQSIEKEKITSLGEFPPMLGVLLEKLEGKKYDISSLKHVGGIDHPSNIEKRKKKANAEFWIGFGQS